MPQVSAYATHSPTDDLKPFKIDRRDVTATDVKIEIEYCGVCHSDIHSARNDWHGSQYPVVPGHEIVGRVTEVGSKVAMFKVGDLVGVGCMVDSCKACIHCEEDLEQYCSSTILTYNSEDPKHGGITYGGYSQQIVVDQDFVLSVPEHLDAKSVAPLLCAGITTYSPLRHWKIKRGDRVGIIGLGGLGHMGVKLASAMGAHVTMITRSPSKGEDARELGADEVLLSTDEAEMAKHADHFDFLLNTIPNTHDVNPYLYLLKRDATMVMVGVIGFIETDVDCKPLVLSRKNLAGSLIGGIAETQEMLDFCGEHNITADVEMIDMADINNAYERMMKSDVKYRFVIDMKTLK
jgi:alcohol dehydrogenase (NADP+)